MLTPEFTLPGEALPTGNIMEPSPVPDSPIKMFLPSHLQKYTSSNLQTSEDSSLNHKQEYLFQRAGRDKDIKMNNVKERDKHPGASINRRQENPEVSVFG